jgi:hypothetical protein
MGLLDDAIREHLELKRRRGADAGDISRQESDALGPVRRLPGGKVDLPDTFEVEQRAEEAPAPTPWADEPTSLHEPPALEDEQTAVHGRPPPLRPTYQPPPARDFTPLGASPPAPPAPSTPSNPSTPYEPPSAPAYEPPATPSYPRAAEPEPESGGWMATPTASVSEPKSWMDPPPEPEPEPDAWMRPRPSLAPEPRRPEIEIEIEPEPQSEPEPEHGSLMSRFRLGRRGKEDEPGPAEREEAPAPPPPAPAGPPADDTPEDVLEETPDFLEETPEHDRLWFEQRPPRDFDFDG